MQKSGWMISPSFGSFCTTGLFSMPLAYDKAQRHAAEEKAAQEARAQALAHLKKTGAKTQREIVQPAASSRTARMRKMDNTMELVRKRKAATAALESQRQRQQQQQQSSGSDAATRVPVSFSIAANKRGGKKRKVSEALGGEHQAAPAAAPAAAPPLLPSQQSQPVWEDASTSGVVPPIRRDAAKLGYGVPRVLTPSEESKLLKGWHIVVEAGAGRTYFWEPKTNRTSWGDPRTIKGPHAAAEAADAGQVLPLLPTPLERAGGPHGQVGGIDDDESIAIGVEYKCGKEYFWNVRTGVSAWSATDVVLKPPPPPKIAGLEPEEDIGDQPMWEYLREKALRERREGSGVSAEGVVPVVEATGEGDSLASS